MTNGRAFTDQEFLQFLIEAKKRGYAGLDDEATVQPLIPGSKQLEWRSAEFLYRDIYVGMARFAGQEMVFHAGKAVWSMVYEGGVTPICPSDKIRGIYALLRQGLSAVTLQYPWRGPPSLRIGGATYANIAAGNLDAFNGVETIEQNGVIAYRLDYRGGWVV